MNENVKFVLTVMGAVFAAYYVGAMYDFLPFLADDLAIRAVGWGTMTICVVIAVCTCILKNNRNGKDDKGDKE